MNSKRPQTRILKREREETAKAAEARRKADDKNATSDASNALTGARQYRDAKEWAKAQALYQSVIKSRKRTPDAVTADIELTAMMKAPAADGARHGKDRCCRHEAAKRLRGIAPECQALSHTAGDSQQCARIPEQSYRCASRWRRRNRGA
jgi:hypothetical protein